MAKKDITLREHMTEIAKERHARLKKTMSKKEYSDMMRNVRLGKKAKKKTAV